MASKTPVFEVYRDAAMLWRWRFVAANGKTVADSAEGYQRRGGCYAGIRLLRATTADGKPLAYPVVDLTA